MTSTSSPFLWKDTVGTTSSGTARWQPPREASPGMLKVQLPLLPLVGRLLAVPLPLVLALSHDIEQRTEPMPKRLGLCLELLYILHPRA